MYRPLPSLLRYPPCSSPQTSARRSSKDLESSFPSLDRDKTPRSTRSMECIECPSPVKHSRILRRLGGNDGGFAPPMAGFFLPLRGPAFSSFNRSSLAAV